MILQGHIEGKILTIDLSSSEFSILLKECKSRGLKLNEYDEDTLELQHLEKGEKASSPDFDAILIYPEQLIVALNKRKLFFNHAKLVCKEENPKLIIELKESWDRPYSSSFELGFKL